MFSLQYSFFLRSIFVYFVKRKLDWLLNLKLSFDKLCNLVSLCIWYLRIKSNVGFSWQNADVDLDFQTENDIVCQLVKNRVIQNESTNSDCWEPFLLSFRRFLDFLSLQLKTDHQVVGGLWRQFPCAHVNCTQFYQYFTSSFCQKKL